MEELVERRERMVAHQIEARGIHDPRVLAAVRAVPRDAFVHPNLVEFAYEDTALPIEENQTISQPYIVALMAEILELAPTDRVLEVGTGSGYAAAVLAHVADEVYTIERHASLAKLARERLEEPGYRNVHVRHGDGTLGWPEHAPYDAIIVSAGGPDIPQALLDQLAVGGRLVIPVGREPRLQTLRRVRRVGEVEYEEDDLGQVRFVPLIGAAGWDELGEARPPAEAPQPARTTTRTRTLTELITDLVEPIAGIEEANLEGLLERVGGARLVLLGEATHGTAEFYNMRARITRELIERKGFRIVAVEADWPDAAAIDRYIRQLPDERPVNPPFRRFPTWMWANTQVLTFVDWLRQYNGQFADPDQAAGFYGLDLYSLYSSIDEVLRYLETIDPETAGLARHRYGCLSPYEGDPATYGAAALTGRYRECEEEVVAALRELLDKQIAYSAHDGRRYFDAAQNARLVANAERYYRTMYYGSRQSWDLRDTHMAETLEALLEFRGPGSKAVVWAHNSHVGDVRATEMGARGELNLGQLCRQKFGADAYLIGFGTDHGTVAAASQWGGPVEIKQVRPAVTQSYERLFHEAAPDAFLLHLKEPEEPALRQLLMDERLERAIGVIYRPETELQSHYFFAYLPRQFDEYIWFDETKAVTPLPVRQPAAEETAETFPFGL